jgi:beta-phosphoglucomutase-like phosphatase (HAD superfamily)
MTSGSPERAKRVLANQGLTFGKAELTKMLDSDDYQLAREKYQLELETAIVLQARENAAYALEVERQAIEKAAELLPMIRSADYAARVASDLSRVKTQNIDKVLSLTGRPAQIIERRSFDEIVHKLVETKLLVPVSDAESTAEEIE